MIQDIGYIREINASNWNSMAKTKNSSWSECYGKCFHHTIRKYSPFQFFFFQSNKELSILLLLRIPRQSEAISRTNVNISKSYSNTKQMPWKKKKNGGNLKSGL